MTCCQSAAIPTESRPLTIHTLGAVDGIWPLTHFCMNNVRNGSVVLQGVSGRFDAKKLIAVMGPSGAGKSTFLNVLCGKAKSYGKVTGTLRVNGEEVRHSIEGWGGGIPCCQPTEYHTLCVAFSSSSSSSSSQGCASLQTRSVNVSPGKRAVGFVPQDDIVHEDLTVRWSVPPPPPPLQCSQTDKSRFPIGVYAPHCLRTIRLKGLFPSFP